MSDQASGESVSEFDHPLFRTNSLRMAKGEGKESGMYNFLMDALIYFEENKDVVQHEVAHRIMNNFGMQTSTFHVISELAGISHALLWAIGELARQYMPLIQGHKLGELVISEPRVPGKHSEEIKAIMEGLLSRVEYVENIIDMGWRGLEPMAELAAIDFAEGVDDVEGGWGLQRMEGFFGPNPPLHVTGMIEARNEYKNNMVEAVLSTYPRDFGGYHVTAFGSFQEAMRHAWGEYSKIQDDKVRKELLRLCMTLLVLDDNQNVQVFDPVKLLLDKAVFAQEHADEARSTFFVDRLYLGSQGLRLVEFVAQEVLEDLPENIYAVRDWAKALRLLVGSQAEWERGGLVDNIYARVLEIFSKHATRSFMTFERKTPHENTVFINSAFLYRAAQNDLLRQDPSWPENLPKDWWRRLILIESVRQGLKSGRPIACPLRAWKRETLPITLLEGDAHTDPMRCDNDCIIRQGLDIANWWSWLPTEKTVCDVTDIGAAG